MSDVRWGVNPLQVDASAQFPLGLVIEDPRGGILAANQIKYVKATAAVTLADSVKLDVAATAAERHASVIPTAAAAGQAVEGIAHVGIANGSFGWITVRGRINANVTAGTAAGDKLSTSGAAAGRLLVSGATAAEANAIASGRPVIALVAESGNRSDVWLG